MALIFSYRMVENYSIPQNWLSCVKAGVWFGLQILTMFRNVPHINQKKVVIHVTKDKSGLFDMH